MKALLASPTLLLALALWLPAGGPAFANPPEKSDPPCAALVAGEERLAAWDWTGAERAFLAAATAPGTATDCAVEAWTKVAEARFEASDYPGALEAGKRGEALLPAGKPGDFRRALFATERAAATLRLGKAAPALEIAGKARASLEKLMPESLELARALLVEAKIERRRSELPAALALLDRALQIVLARAPGTLAEARVRYERGQVAYYQQRLDDGEKEYEAALAIARRLAPGGTDEGQALAGLGSLISQRGDLDRAGEILLPALARQAVLHPGGNDLAAALLAVGSLERNRGDLDQAEKRYGEAEEIYRRTAPGSVDLASVLINQGITAAGRGDLAGAEERFRAALALQEAAIPDSVDVSSSLNNLGAIAEARGDLDLAGYYFGRALKLFERHSPGGMDVGLGHNNLALVAIDRKDYRQAERHARKALEVYQREAPDSLDLADCYNTLGHVLQSLGNWKDARASFERDLELTAKLAPGSLAHATSLDNLAALVAERGELALAEALLTQALGIRQLLSPGSVLEATDLHGLGVLAREAGQLEKAAGLFKKAVEVFEGQIGTWGGGQEIQASYLEGSDDYYRDLVDLLAERNGAAEAFHVLERFRSRALLDQLRERDLVPEADLPAELGEARRRIFSDYDRLQAELTEVPPESPAAGDEVRGELRRLREEYQALRERIRRESPQWAALQDPTTLDFEGARSALDPGTVMLSFSVGHERSRLFLVAPGQPLEVRTIALGEAALRAEVERFRSLVLGTRAGSPVWKERSKSLRALGRRLYDLLIGPAEASLRGASRLVLVPDGPLHVLPWGALVGPGPKPKEELFLVERMPFHLALSATLYQDLQERWEGGAEEGEAVARKEAGTAPALVAFADPAVPQGLRQAASNAQRKGRGVAKAPGKSGPKAVPARALVKDEAVGSALRQGATFEPLPASRKEAEGIAGLFPAGARIFLGDEATEERAKEAGARARYLHFATHVTLDERQPLNSAVVLALPSVFEEGRDNGLLQAWELFDKVRLEADLVVLSGCESALGREIGGEGLQSLTRAFLYAGARTVSASLWKVSDRATAELMLRFYRHLAAGESKDRALRAAQIELLRAPGGGRDLADPFSWAAFQIYGDWR